MPQGCCSPCAAVTTRTLPRSVAVVSGSSPAQAGWTSTRLRTAASAVRVMGRISGGQGQCGAFAHRAAPGVNWPQVVEGGVGPPGGSLRPSTK